MAIKLSKDVIEELDELMEKLSKGDPEDRQMASARLVGYESSGKIPLEAILEMADDENPSVSIYAIQALSRNKSGPAIKKLVKKCREVKDGNLILLETIIDALGATGDPSTAPLLFELVGMQYGTMARVKARFKGKAKAQGNDSRRINHLMLPVVRALSGIQDPKIAEKLGGFLEHEDSLVRWHAIQGLLKTRVTTYNDRLKKMASDEKNEIVREACEIALAELAPLPDNLNN